MSAIDLKSLLSEESIGIHEIGDAIDAASPADRIDAVFALDRDGQRTLFRKAEAATPLTLDDFVPAHRGPRTPVRHRGSNTLPFPARHKLFNKCFCRPDDESTRLFGYNDAPSRSWVGPGSSRSLLGGRARNRSSYAPDVRTTHSARSRPSAMSATSAAVGAAKTPSNAS